MHSHYTGHSLRGRALLAPKGNTCSFVGRRKKRIIFAFNDIELSCVLSMLLESHRIWNDEPSVQASLQGIIYKKRDEES